MKLTLVPYGAADSFDDDLRAKRHVFIERLGIRQPSRTNIPTPTICVVVSLSAGTFRIQSKVPLAYSVKARFGP